MDVERNVFELFLIKFMLTEMKKVTIVFQVDNTIFP